jgi:hypothetical protein
MQPVATKKEVKNELSEIATADNWSDVGYVALDRVPCSYSHAHTDADPTNTASPNSHTDADPTNTNAASSNSHANAFSDADTTTHFSNGPFSLLFIPF